MTDDKKQLITIRTGGGAIALRTPTQTWAQKLSAIPLSEGEDGFYAGYTPPADDVDPLPLIEAAFRAQVTPEMEAQLSADANKQIENLTGIIAERWNPNIPVQEMPDLAPHLANLAAVHPSPLVFHKVAEAVSAKLGIPYNDAFWGAKDLVLDHRDEHGQENAEPELLDINNPGYIADRVLESAGGSIEFSDKNTWFFGGDRQSVLGAQALIRRALGKFDYCDGYMGPAKFVDSRLVREVTLALQAKCYRPPEPDFSKGGNVIDVTRAAPIMAPVAPPDYFEDRLTLEPRVVTESARLVADHARWREAKGLPPVADNLFFTELKKWGGPRVERTKPHINGRRVPGYRGVKIND